jgi:hypothetical protein
VADHARQDRVLAGHRVGAKYQAYEVRAVERILEARFSPRRFDEQIADATRARIRGLMHDHPVHQRSLDSYTALKTGDRRPTKGNDDGQETSPQASQCDDDDRASATTGPAAAENGDPG